MEVLEVSLVRIPVGPQHPALHEPENFTIEVEGETVVDVKVRIGYVHRGIEKGLESRTYVQGIFLSGRICGICSNCHTTTYAMTVEEAGGIEVPEKANYIRTIISELERIHSHLLWLGSAGLEIGFETMFMYVWRDREVVMDLLEAISGNRVNYAINIVGGVRRDITPELAKEIRKGLDYLEERTNYYKKLCFEETTIRKRTEGVGVLDTVTARKLGAVGPTARGSNVKFDVRKDDPHLKYDEAEFELITWDTCDTFARIVVRILEVLESIKIVRWCLDHMPKKGDIRPQKIIRRVPEGEAYGRFECQRGELVYFVKSDGSDKPYRVKVRTPTMANILSVPELLKGGYIADVPIALASIDPCFACEDRITFVDVEKERKWTWTKEQLRKYAMEFNRREGRW
nr:NADH dehydrogenase subunit [Candidatus Bathyarchaeota archaeon]